MMEESRRDSRNRFSLSITEALRVCRDEDGEENQLFDDVEEEEFQEVVVVVGWDDGEERRGR